MNEREMNYRLPKRVKLNIACVYLDNYKIADDRGVISKAREILDKHNIELSVWPGNGSKQPGVNTLTYLDLPELAERNEIKYIPHEDWAYKALRKAVDKKIKGSCTFIYPLPVVFCNYIHSGYGVTPPETKLATSLTRACLIAQTGNSDKVDLLHEMGHSVAEIGDGHSPDKGNFMHTLDGRSFMYRFQVERMGRAMYAVG
jgi:hypothetical protein